MFWRFGFDNGSSLDSLLDKDEVSLEAILDEDDLLQECKSQNTRLIDYFQKVDVLQRLFGYVSGQIEAEDTGKFKYPYVSTEVLCSEIWSIVETCLNHSDQLLVTFWETVLDRDAEDMKTRMVMASHFVKINAVFLSKKPAEMLAFIRAQPDVVERLLRHIETPAIGDLLVRIIQLDEQPGGAGVLEWLSEERLVARLVDRLSPAHSPDMHTVIAELIKSIVSMAAPSPTAGMENSQIGPASNRFARELARRDIVQTLVDYMLTDFGPDPEATRPDEAAEDQDSDTQPAKPTTFPNFESSTSSVLHSICIIIELIRQNNSDFFEPYLFHTLRNRLIQVQQQLTTRDAEESRIILEGAMQEMVDRMGVVHLGPILDILSDKLEQLQAYLLKPRSLEGPLSTTVGSITPLTFERYRICELFAELLHCSNMALLNRPSEFDYLYDAEGRLQGGLSALEELARVLSMGQGDDNAEDEGMDDIEPAMELPVHGSASQDNASLLDSDEDMSDGEGPSDDEAMEDISVSDSNRPMRDGAPSPSPSSSPTRTASSPLDLSVSPTTVPSMPSPVYGSSPGGSSPDVSAVPRRKSSNASLGSNSSTRGRRSTGSKRSSRMFQMPNLPPAALPSGERLKRKLLDNNVLSTVLDLFFDFPWNNFLHSVTYDLIHQILTGRVDTGANRELAISLFRDAKLMHRIVEGQRRNDAECAKPKSVRLGYMGHLTLISEDVLLALDHFPSDLRSILASHAPQPEWDEYVNGRYNETKERDTSLLGGGKPVAGRTPTDSWKVDETEIPPASTDANTEDTPMHGEFKRATGNSTRREGSADFGPAPINDEDEPEEQSNHPSFARYLAQEMHSPNAFGADLGDSSDASDDEDDGGWLTNSQFNLEREPPTSTRERRPLSATGFDDAFAPETLAVASSPFADPFASEDDPDDGFGSFTESSTSADPFTFSSSFSDGMDESFGEGDFGDFHSADGETTPTAGSWTFTSGSSEDGEGEKEGKDEEPTTDKHDTTE